MMMMMMMMMMRMMMIMMIMIMIIDDEDAYDYHNSDVDDDNNYDDDDDDDDDDNDEDEDDDYDNDDDDASTASIADDDDDNDDECYDDNFNFSYFSSVMPRGLDTMPRLMKLLLIVLVEGVTFMCLTFFVLRCHYREQDDYNRDDDDEKLENGTSDIHGEKRSSCFLLSKIHPEKSGNSTVYHVSFLY